MKERIETIIKEALSALGVEASNIVLEHPADIAHGDYATNVALVYCKIAGVSPRDLAEKIVAKIRETNVTEIKSVEIAGPGFVNFFIKDEVIREENNKEKSFLKTKYTGQNILVEHSSPNLFKPFSIGHLMNNFVGEFIARATKIGGGNVKAMTFPSDVSLGVAKALFIIERDIKENKIDLSYFKNGDEDDVVKYLGEAYVRGVKECEENEDSLNKAKKVLDKIYNLKDDDFYDLVNVTRSRNENHFKMILKELGSDIDAFVYEREAGAEGSRIVKENIGKVFTESEGAVVYVPGEERKDINTSVFINSQGYPTYEAKDLGLMSIKLTPKLSAYGINHFSPDVSLFVTDHEQASHFKVVFDAAEKLGNDWKEWVSKSRHVSHGRMTFKGQKMSSRLGGVPLALEVIETVREEVRERAGEKIAHLNVEEKNKLEKDVALSALRIAVLRSRPGININFDPETSLSFEGDSGPYLLYTHARCASLLEKGYKRGDRPAFKSIPVTTLERELAQYELVLTESIENLAPQKLVTYLFEVAQLFNGFYGNIQVLTDDKETSGHYLAVVRRVKAVLREGLWVLGIQAPDKM